MRMCSCSLLFLNQSCSHHIRDFEISEINYLSGYFIALSRDISVQCFLCGYLVFKNTIVIRGVNSYGYFYFFSSLHFYP